MCSQMDSDSDNSNTELQPNIKDVLLLDDNETYTSNQKQKKHYYGKKRYKNVKASTNVEITNEVLEKIIIDDLSGQYFPGYVKYFKSHYKGYLEKSQKSSQKSIEARIKGNESFAKTTHSAQIHKDIWELYSKSIAFAPSGSKELVLAYECRSNLLLHLKKYSDCVKDIDEALNITNFDLLKVKLLCRKMTCCMAMGKDINEKMELWNTLCNHLKAIDVAFKDQKFVQMIEQAKNDSQRETSKTVNQEKCSCCATRCVSNSNDVDMVFQKEIRIVATRDFVPGERVIVTKPLVTSFNPNKFYAYCSHCLSFMWAGIPCDDCSLCMYCSEKCKVKAWDEYHASECKLLPHINFEDISYNVMHLSTRIFLRGLKEFGNVFKLKEKLQEVDKLRGDCKLGKNLLESDFLQFYVSLYTHINSSAYNLNVLSKVAMKACFLLYCMIQTLDIFKGKNFKLFRGKELAKEQDIVSCGLVMLKILVSITRNIKPTAPTYTSDDVCDKYNNNTDCDANRHCLSGSYYDVFNAMFEKSCNPNVAACWTDSGEIIYFCVQPIKKNEKITITNSDEFFVSNKAKRDRSTLFSIYCQCTACLKDWPIMEKMFEKTKHRRMKIESRESKIVQKYFEKNQSKADYVTEDNCIFNEEEYQQLLRDVNDVVKACGQPSFASSLMIDYLSKAFELEYGTLPLLLQIPEKC